MSYPHELHVLASETAHGDPNSQANLRRAVSTAYYALFHFLVAEASANWAQSDLRPKLSRYFDHGPMKAASEAVAKSAGPLKSVAAAFVRLQENRLEADYNVARMWSIEEVDNLIFTVGEAFEAWDSIRSEPAAQSYLLTLLRSRSRP
jgi:uncharacterized protein (UPF0332 family)